MSRARRRMHRRWRRRADQIANAPIVSGLRMWLRTVTPLSWLERVPIGHIEAIHDDGTVSVRLVAGP